MPRFIPVFALFSLVSLCAAEEPDLRKPLEAAYARLQEVLKQGDEKEAGKAFSSFTYAEIRNGYASMRRAFDAEAMRSMAGFLPDLSRGRFVKTLRNGATAGLAYVLDDPPGDDGKPRVQFVLVRFVEEEGSWRQDGIAAQGAPRLKKDGSETRFEDVAFPGGLAVDGKVRKAPALLPMPDAVGFLDVESIGYETKVTVDGVEQDAVRDTNFSGIVKGGLKKGRNAVRVAATPLPGAATKRFKVSIAVVDKDGRRGPEVYRSGTEPPAAEEAFEVAVEQVPFSPTP